MVIRVNIKKSKLKCIFSVTILTLFILHSLIMTPNNLSYQKNDTYIESPFNDKKDNPSMSQTDLDNPIYGDGLNQTVRAYMKNLSTSTMTNGSFNITAPNLNSKLTAGEFNFTFDQNYNTTYEIENDAAYDYPIKKFIFVDNATLNLLIGTEDGKSGIYNMTDDDPNTFWNVTSVSNIINFTITLNFSNYFEPGYNYLNICRIDIDLRANLTENTNLTVKIWDNIDKVWKIVSSDIFINRTNPDDEFINLDLINKNLRFINKTGISSLQFIYINDTPDFNLSLYEFDAFAYSVFELSITNNIYVALEFDLRGNATVYGFQTWIRALNLSAAINSNLTISLLRANDTVLRSQITGDTPPAENILIKPNDDDLFDSFNVTGYINDMIIHFNFTTPITNLNVSNYFIVIKSNISTDAFHLMILPQTAPPLQGCDPDGLNNHLLLKTEDNGYSWVKVYKSTYWWFDASPFIINVTRGWIPNDILNITLENKTLSNMEISTYPYNQSSTYTWGLGNWTGEFEEPINSSNGAKFEITLNWNKSITSHLFFNVSYSATAYSLENATAHYNCTYNSLPKWELNYTFNNDSSYFITNWSFLEFWYIYPLYWSSYDLLCADNISKYDENSAGTLSENGVLGKYIVQNVTIIDTSNPDHNGVYSLKLTSFNCIYNMTTYLHFKNSHSWPTNGFMLGDNVSISLNVQDHDGKPVSDGIANSSLFLPNGTKFDIWYLSDSEGIIDDTFNVTSYDFNNSNIFNSTFLSEKGSYTIGFFWKNGTAVGCKKKIIYLSDYDFNILDCTYDKEEGGNIFEGNLIRANTDLTNYSLLITTVKESTGINTLDKFTINNIISEQFSNVDNLTVEITNFLQNETIISPDEKISFKIKVKNKDFFPFNVRLSIQLISPINPNWIISEVNTPNQLLNFTGTPNDSYEFYYNTTLNNKNPDGTWNGINSPIRLGGCLTKIKVYIEDEFSGSWINNDYSIIIKDNETVFEGEVLSFKYLEGLTSRGLVLNFSRDDFNIPGITSFFINIIDEYYMSTLNQINKAFSFKLDSSFQNLSVNPSEVIWGKKFNLTTYLRTEKGEPISGEEIHFYFLNSSNIWQELVGTEGDNHNLTDLNGKAIMEIDSNQFTKNSSGKIKLNWTGNSYILTSEINYTIDFIIYSNEIIIESVTNNTIFLRNKENQMDIIIKNVGTSILTDINITLITNFSYTLSKYNNYELNYLKPEETTGISYKISIPNIDDNNITILVNISFKTIQTNEENEFQYFLTYDLDDESLFTQIVQLSILFLFIGIGLFYLLALLYRVRINKKIEKIFEKPLERKRKGKYVKVSELRAKEIEKKDLDELLKEEKIK
ncbi:hypothetical protein ES706_03766 [subsurface metagenome]